MKLNHKPHKNQSKNKIIKSKINNRIQANNINIIKREGKIHEKNPHKILKHMNINQHNKNVPLKKFKNKRKKNFCQRKMIDEEKRNLLGQEKEKEVYYHLVSCGMQLP